MKVDKLYEELEKVILAENYTYSEVNSAIDLIKSRYGRKANNLLLKTNIQEIAKKKAF